MNKPRFSVWTATYNRAKFLPRLYYSLHNQTLQNFEWIIIDDGSTDETENIVQGFISENKLKSIRYIKKENGGKHTAWRVATNLFSAPYVITIDSDDILLPDALLTFNKYWTQLERSQDYHFFWEVKGRCKNEEGLLIGKKLPQNVFDSSTDEMAFKYRYKKEMHACRKTSVLRNEAKVPDNFPFENKCSNFSESIRWSRAGRKYKTRYFDEIVRIYYTDAEDSLTSKRKVSQKGLYNSLVQTIYAIKERRDLMIRWDVQTFLKTVIVFHFTCFALGKDPFKILEGKFLENIFLKLMIVPSFFYWKSKKIRFENRDS